MRACLARYLGAPLVDKVSITELIMDLKLLLRVKRPDTRFRFHFAFSGPIGLWSARLKPGLEEDLWA